MATENDLEEERLREAVRALPEAKRKLFYERADSRIRDPDTYAALNWSLLLAAHHIYLGHWGRALMNLVLLIAGIALLLPDDTRWFGGLLLVGLTVWELFELFFSQSIVQRHNNEVMAQVLQELSSGARAG